jgi:hypothetical protein
MVRPVDVTLLKIHQRSGLLFVYISHAAKAAHGRFVEMINKTQGPDLRIFKPESLKMTHASYGDDIFAGRPECNLWANNLVCLP